MDRLSASKAGATPHAGLSRVLGRGAKGAGGGRWGGGASPALWFVFGLLGIALFWGWTITAIVHDRQRTTEDAVRSSANLTRIFDEHALRTLNSADRMLIDMRRQFSSQGAQFDIGLFFSEWHTDSEYIISGGLTDASGALVLNTLGDSKGVNLADREHFKVHSKRDSDDLHVSVPLMGRINNRPSLVLTRRNSSPTGAFAGVAALAINPNYFRDFFAQVNLGPQATVMLTGLDGLVRVRWVAEEAVSITGQDLTGGELMNRVRLSDVGWFFVKAQADGVRRLVSYRKVHGYPLVISVGISEDVLFEGYFERRRVRVGVALLISTLVLFGLLGMRVYSRREAAAAKKASESEGRYRLLLDGITDAVVLRDAKGWIVDCNAGAEQMFHTTRAAMRGQQRTRPDWEALNEDGTPRIEAGRANRRALLSDCVETVITQYRKTDNGTLWVKVVAVPMRTPGGGYLTVTTSSDITAIKVREAKRTRAADELRVTLVNEVHHRIKNSLQGVIGLLHEEFRQLPDCEAAMNRAISRVRAISVSYGLMGRAGVGEIVLQDLLLQICEAQLGAAGPRPTIELDDGIAPLLVGEVDAVPLALILNEILHNAEKHGGAHGGETRISLRLDVMLDCATVLIRNPGRLPQHFDFLTGKGLGSGLRLVSALLPKRGGALKFREADGHVEVLLEMTAPVIRTIPNQAG